MMEIPGSTYRIQFHKDFTFKDLESIIDYLHDLGITTIYASPITAAVGGSTHGYDVIDPHQINPEIGTREDLKRIREKLSAKKMSWIQDIVPNHMAFHVSNSRLMDVLERGPHSEFYNYFDILWDHSSPDLKGRLQVPFLGKPLDQAIAEREIAIDYDDGGFVLRYLSTAYPLSVSAYRLILPAEFDRRLTALAGLPLQQWTDRKRSILSEMLADDEVSASVIDSITQLNQSPQCLEEVIHSQYYLLTFWQDTAHEINYRRFFTVNELVCLRMEDPFVFEDYHRFIHQLYADDLIQGLRIDHIDGLYDPVEYILRLRQLFGYDCYIIAEKILEAKEILPVDWPLQGTSGYEFLSTTSQLITNRHGAKKLLAYYHELRPDLASYKDIVNKNKTLILENYMAGEWNNLVDLYISLELPGYLDRQKAKNAVAALMIAMPVYRIYPITLPLTGDSRQVMQHAFERALGTTPGAAQILEGLRILIFESNSGSGLKFLKRMMQFTGPLTAKGVEDTTFYEFNALISHGEVGDTPSSLGISVTAFHRKMADRQLATPLSLNATATHDTKRGEDARLRVNVLCDFPEEWISLVQSWRSTNRKFKTTTSTGIFAPSDNDEYYIYQSILGGFPHSSQIDKMFLDRLMLFEEKVLREAKTFSSWTSPDKEYESGCKAFVRSILEPESEFLRTFVPFFQSVGNVASKYSIAQTLIKITAPGIPDTYQGAELWDLSFVDPDNRRVIDYDLRKTLLHKIKSAQGNSVPVAGLLAEHRLAGIEKLWVTFVTLNWRKINNDLFIAGNYIPLQTSGKEAFTVAYARCFQSRWVVVLVPLRAKSSEDDNIPDSELIYLPKDAPSRWRNLFTSETTESSGTIAVADCCRNFPVALLENF